eukprot:15345173-Ditylum_brightwellii.AAC.1
MLQDNYNRDSNNFSQIYAPLKCALCYINIFVLYGTCGKKYCSAHCKIGLDTAPVITSNTSIIICTADKVVPG